VSLKARLILGPLDQAWRRSFNHHPWMVAWRRRHLPSLWMKTWKRRHSLNPWMKRGAWVECGLGSMGCMIHEV